MSETKSPSEPVIIKKYANRRLYNTGSSSYITLDHLGTMTREGIEFKVLDAKTGEDITRSVLTQIIMDEETHGQTMLPTSFLRQIISMYGDSMQSMVPPYLEASMAALRRNQEEFKKSMSGSLNPLEAIAKQNLKMFEAAAALVTGKTPEPVGDEDEAKSNHDIEDMKRQMAELQGKLDKLSKS